METFKTILVTDDLDDENNRSERVRSFATLLAQKLKTDIKLFHAVDLRPIAVEIPLSESITRPIIDERKSKLKHVATSMGVDTDVLLYEGSPIEGIIEESKSDSIELIVQGSQGKRGLKRAILGSVAEEVIRHSHVPVITLGPHITDTYLTETRVLVATDLGKNSAAAEDYATNLALALKAELVLSHTPFRAFESGIRADLGIPYTPIYTEVIYQQHLETVRQELEQKARKLTKRGICCRPQLKENSFFTVESLKEDIQTEKPFLLVMGTHGRNLFSSFYFGSTTREMILSSSVPVVTVRSFNS